MLQVLAQHINRIVMLYVWLCEYASSCSFLSTTCARVRVGGLLGNRSVGSTGFAVPARLPSSRTAGQTVGRMSLLLETPSGTGARVDALVESSSAIELPARRMWHSSRTWKVLSSFLTRMRYAASCGSLQLHSQRTCLISSCESPLTSS